MLMVLFCACWQNAKASDQDVAFFVRGAALFVSLYSPDKYSSKETCDFCSYPMPKNPQLLSLHLSRCNRVTLQTKKDAHNKTIITSWLDALWQQTMLGLQPSLYLPIANSNRGGVPRLVPTPQRIRTLIIQRRLQQQEQHQPNATFLNTDELAAVCALAALAQQPLLDCIHC